MTCRKIAAIAAAVAKAGPRIAGLHPFWEMEPRGRRALEQPAPAGCRLGYAA